MAVYDPGFRFAIIAASAGSSGISLMRESPPVDRRDHPAELGCLPIIVGSNNAGLVVQFEDRISQRAGDA
jgi:hypothetical protein